MIIRFGGVVTVGAGIKWKDKALIRGGLTYSHRRGGSCTRPEYIHWVSCGWSRDGKPGGCKTRPYGDGQLFIGTI